MPKVSIIMPSLNVVDYIKAAVDSVLSQTLEDIEILCVDAGSTDGTLEILEEYVERDSRVRLIRSEKKSYGYQMNLGIKSATGEYIGIVETDDYIESEMLWRLYEVAKENEADIVKSDFDLFLDGEDGIRYFVPYSLRRMNRVEYGRVYSRVDYIDEVVKPECYIWNAIYKRDFLMKKGVRFNETPGASFQDFSFRYQTVYQAERIIAIEDVQYHYRRDNSGASTYNPRAVEFNLREATYIWKLFEERIKDKRVFSALANEITEFAFWPYLDLRKWIEPAESTKQAYTGYKEMMNKLIDQEFIKKEKINADLWRNALFLREGEEVFMGYAKVVAELERESIVKYINDLKEKDDIVIYGSGIRGNAIYVFLKNNGVNNIRAFCDGDRDRQGRELYGIKIISPEEAALEYRYAGYIISSIAGGSQMRTRLKEIGIEDNSMLDYNLSTHPLFCTNCSMKSLVRERI